MLQQPELGKKISELRKVKGFTQEELVEKCNLNVRTLQRIEAGQVTPRHSTIKLIFEVLEVPVDKALENEGHSPKGLVPGQSSVEFIDFFNLKTNALKKISIIVVFITPIILGITSFHNKSKSQDIVESKISEIENSGDTLKIKKIKIAGIYDGWHNNEEFTGRDVYCNFNGIWIKTPLMSINKKTNTFRTSCIQGIFLDEGIVQITNMHCQPRDRIISNVSFSGEHITYSGKLVFSDEEFISAPKIIINRD